MSFDRKKVVSRLESFSKRIVEHVAMCILYTSNYPSYRHWVEDEISTWILEANEMTVRGNKRLKCSDYADLLFGEFGDSKTDARLNLRMQYAVARDKNPPYPEVVITPSKIEKMFKACYQITSYFSKALATNNNLTKGEIVNKIHSILDPLCE